MKIRRETLAYKAKATGIHFSISLLIFAVFLFFMLTRWYPLPYFHTDGGWEGTRIMIAVDLVLGPLLTFLVFHPKKRGKALIFDASFIAIIQLTALIWGGMTVHDKRTMVIVYAEGSFNPVTYKELSRHGVSDKQLQRFSDLRPPIVLFEEPRTRQELIAQGENLKKGIGVFEQLDRYRPVKSFTEVILKFSLSMNKDLEKNRAYKKRFDQIVSRYNVDPKEVALVMYYGSYRPGHILINKNSGDVLGMIPVTEYEG